ncbi:unnamed protein product [Miscanthus lutarioriparius]|uniref:F-box domain-containing protein n=1 Tax=Miscanthus lutarioriparius TaxID=422564 RepID=A0A811SRN7_9POAL|nr:unnamed protein product [Miscanthus lutarioriparius]
MPPRKNARKNAFAAAAVGGGDHIGSLPDGVLQHMLSFLPAQDAVRTCVLAKRWRHMWKSTTVLRFVCGGMNEPKSMKEIQDFVDQLLRLRICGGTPLDTCEFRLGKYDEFDMSRMVLWIRIALQCKVQVLQLICLGNHPGIGSLDGHPFFISQYLKKLELNGIYFGMDDRFLDFSCCPVLEDLEIVDCYLGYALLISSQSLKRLTIEIGDFGDDDRLPICAPNLVSLWLEVSDGRIPSLERMPSLLVPYVKIDTDFDCNFNSDSDDDEGDDNNQSILLQGLSEVRNLVLISCYLEMFIFRRDLRFCSSFNKLKSLLVDEYWCQPADFSALACLLKLSPVLEKLTLQLYSKGPKHKVEIKLSCKPMEISAEISRHFKTLEVKCEVYDERISNVLTFLSEKLNILWFQLYEWKCLDL